MINDVDGADLTAAETTPAYTTAAITVPPVTHFRGNHWNVTAQTSRNGTIGHNLNPQPTRLDGENPSRSTNEKIS